MVIRTNAQLIEVPRALIPRPHPHRHTYRFIQCSTFVLLRTLRVKSHLNGIQLELAHQHNFSVLIFIDFAD